MAEFFDWNAARGVWYETEDSPEGLIIHTKQDVQPSLDWAKKQRNNGLNDPGGKHDKSDIKHYATIPTHVELALRDKGINIWDKNDQKKMFREIETNYPLSKVTSRKIL